MTASQEASRAAQAATDNPVIRTLGRGGLVAHGVVHLLLAYLAVKVALGGSTGGEEADKTGALATIGEQPGGGVLLWVVAVGLAALAVWQAAEAIWGMHRFQGKKRTFKRVGCGARAVLYAALGVNAAKLATGGGSGEQETTVTARVLELPFGQALVAIVGLIIVGVAGYLVYYGLSKTFTEDLDLAQASPSVRKATVRLGQAGYPAVGAAYGGLGLLIVIAAVTYDPEKSAGLDGALKTLAAQPFGAIALCIIAAGLAAYGIYRFFDSRFHKA